MTDVYHVMTLVGDRVLSVAAVCTDLKIAEKFANMLQASGAFVTKAPYTKQNADLYVWTAVQFPFIAYAGPEWYKK
jgi:hypothetical protein